MGLLQRAVETYDSHQKKCQTLAPICHTIQNVQIEIMLDEEGHFISASTVAKDDMETPIPATEDSAARSGKNAFMVPHPLCDKLSYMIGDNKYYLSALEEWEQSEYTHPTLTAVRKYIQSGTILFDLEHSGLVKTKNGKLAKGRVNNKDYQECFIRWKIAGLSDEYSMYCWTDKLLQERYISYTLDKLAANSEEGLCMVSGEQSMLSKKSPRGIIKKPNGAKLISSNDNDNYTFRGRFTNSKQALTVGFVASQKAHNALRWLVHDQGVTMGRRTFICWNPQGKQFSAHQMMSPLMKRRKQRTTILPSDYKEKLFNTIVSIKKEQQLKGTEQVVIAALDATTESTGRLSLTYYNELSCDLFLQRLQNWDEWCCWLHHPYGIEAPSLKSIVDFAFGTLQKGKFVTKDVVLREQMQQLLICRLNGTPFPFYIERALVNRCSRLTLYSDDSESGYLRSDLLFTTCAVLRKYYQDKKEEWKMALEPENKDRSYQFGRLLAVYEQVELSARREKESRNTNALRLQARYCKTPFTTASIIATQLFQAYFPSLSIGSQNYYKNIIDQIMDVISNSPEQQWNRPLKDTYLMGYHLQRNSLRQRNKKNDSSEQEENDNE